MPTGQEFTENFMAHFGVKGMRWGRRKETVLSTINDTEVTIKTAPGTISVSGGRGRMPSQDAIDSVKYRQIAKASSSHALSNKELRALVDRINLEQQYSRAVNPTNPNQIASKQKAINWVTTKVLGIGNMVVDTAIKVETTERVNRALNVEARKAASQVRVANLVKAASGG